MALDNKNVSPNMFDIGGFLQFYNGLKNKNLKDQIGRSLQRYMEGVPEYLNAQKNLIGGQAKLLDYQADAISDATVIRNAEQIRRDRSSGRGLGAQPLRTSIALATTAGERDALRAEQERRDLETAQRLHSLGSRIGIYASPGVRAKLAELRANETTNSFYYEVPKKDDSKDPASPKIGDLSAAAAAAKGGRVMTKTKKPLRDQKSRKNQKVRRDRRALSR